MTGGTVAKFVAGKSLYENCGKFVIVRADDLDAALAAQEELPRIIAAIKSATTFGELRAAVDSLPHEAIYDLDLFLFDSDINPYGGEPFSSDLCYDPESNTLTTDGSHPRVMDMSDISHRNVDELKVAPSVRAACVDRIGADPDAGMLPVPIPSVLDTALCYRAMTKIPEVMPYLKRAQFDADAGFDDLTKPLEILRDLGHTVELDDARIAQACG
jgi:hypothetical protein